ncbi:MAG: hypothetical protein V4695_08690 [Pseudomonadota bacterium]
MDYSNREVSALFQGPLRSTPQDWVVLFCAFVYLVLALVLYIFEIAPPFGKSVSTAIAICISWPLVVFLVFVKQGIPSFAPSWRGAVYIGVVSAMPVLHFLYLKLD